MRIIALLLVTAAALSVAASCPHGGRVVRKAEPVVLAYFQFLPAAAPAQPPAPPAPPAPDGPPIAIYGDDNRPGARLLARHCAGCHTRGSARAGIVLFDPVGTFAPGLGRAVVAEAVRADRMPLGAKNDPGKRLSPQEKSLVLTFLEGERP